MFPAPFFLPSFFTLHLKEQCHVLSDHLTQSLEDPSLLSDHLYLPLFFSVSFATKYTHTHTLPVGGGGFSRKSTFSPIAKGELAFSFSGNKVMVPF